VRGVIFFLPPSFCFCQILVVNWMWVLLRSCFWILMWVGFVIFICEFLLLLQVFWKIWDFVSFNFRLLLLLNLSNKFSLSSYEILFINSYVSMVCYFHSWISLKLASFVKGMFSSFSFKLLLLSDLGNKLSMNFCEFLWDLVWVQIFCTMHIAFAKLKLEATYLCIFQSYQSCDRYEL
jgi:hypothetical protein